ncbi:MAG: hypothetical protein OXE41_10665 [Gammaproteobacteria bacterium]|nr:hypothetical protein [Gammaproteobacteria bacterium]MCY4217672.1 hypothetical protein [Gammaproteobacteria bacterium]MCY4275836.1 hypothetical protein [Gammaproteobacteria bacterium]
MTDVLCQPAKKQTSKFYLVDLLLGLWMSYCESQWVLTGLLRKVNSKMDYWLTIPFSILKGYTLVVIVHEI